MTTQSVAFGPTGSLRETVGARGGVHIDRPLPFIAVQRTTAGKARSLSRRVALTSPAYLVWEGPADDGASGAALEAVLAEQARHFGTLLVISLYDLPRPKPVPDDAPALPAFQARIGASHDAPSQAAAEALGDAMRKVEIDLRRCEVGPIGPVKSEPGIGRLIARGHIAHVSLGLPRIDIAPGGKTFYPQVFHDLAVAVFDALLKAACAFMTEAGLGAPHHYRMLGRSAFVDAARSVDAKLNRICRGFDFLLSVSPINTTQAFNQFRDGKWRRPPDFQYRPLTVDPVEAKRALYRIELKGVEDPTLETLFAEKRQEIDHQLTMLELRNSPRFRFASLMLYEPVDSALRDAATEILAADTPAAAAEDDGPADCHVVADAAQQMIERYAARGPGFAVKVELRDDIAAGMMVSSDNLYISTATRMPRHRVDPLLQHEVGIHLLTFVNGAAQGLNIFKRGLAGYEGFQEGLGVFAEWAVGGLTHARLRLLAARVLAVDAMTDGGGFTEVFQLLRREHGFTARTAFLVTARVFRSGGLAKDAIYLRGFKTVLDLLADGQSLDPYWYGKIDARHVGVVVELAERGLLRKPALAPEFLSSEVAAARIAGLRKKLPFSSLMAGAA